MVQKIHREYRSSETQENDGEKEKKRQKEYYNEKKTR